MSRGFHTNRRGGLYVFQDVDENIDYELDWSEWLPSGDTIDSVSYTVNGVTLSASSHNLLSTTIWVRGTDGYVTTHIVSAAGREKDKTITFKERYS